MHKKLLILFGFLLLCSSLSNAFIPYRRSTSAPTPIDISSLQAAFPDRVTAVWRLSRFNSTNTTLIRYRLNQKLDREDTTPRLSADQAIAVIQEIGLNMNNWELAGIPDGRYTRESIKRYSMQAFEQNAYRAIADIK